MENGSTATLAATTVAGEFAAALLFGLFLDAVKIPIFAHLKISSCI
jgi:hypothetical protein